MAHARTHETKRKSAPRKAPPPVVKQPDDLEEQITQAIAEHCPATHGSEDPLAQARKAASAVMAIRH